MAKVTLVTDTDGNVIGGSLASSSDFDPGATCKSTLVALEGQKVHYDVSLTSDLLTQEDNEALVSELLKHRIDAEGKLVREH
ncbi:hypothetical protein [Streptomyces sp. NBC_00207]|uniref:hypothetical protein n=1 Tax=unclassified Streptomyces TaxID=2593676 RepID=UPI002885AC3E|nr:hypothetical protein [Streptomyces sp. DSM 41633]